ncbi:MAG: hypothetical protein ACRC4X_01265 [Cetobacterium sp.]
MNHSFDIDLATRFGIEEAILIENIAFWVKKNQANNKNFYDGEFWTFNSAAAFQELFPYMNLKKIQRTLNRLEEQKIIKSGNYNKLKMDRTKWYCIDDSEIKILYKLTNNVVKSPLDKMSNGLDTVSNGFAQNVQPIPYVNTDINTDIKNKHVTCSHFKKSEKKIMLGLNPKGYPQKDEWEKFLNKNLIGIDYTPVIEKAIKKLLKTENERAVEKILLETYKTGLNENRSIAEIATIIGTGNALRAKAVKPKKEKAVEVPAEQKEKIEVASSFDKEKEFIQKRELEKQEAENQKLPEVILTPELEKELLAKAEQDGISSAFLSKMKLRNSFMYENMLKKYI